MSTQEAGDRRRCLRYLLNVLCEDLHGLHRLGVAQLDRPLVVHSCAAPRAGLSLAVVVYVAELVDCLGTILSRGLLEPRLRLLVVHGDALAVAVHAAELVLAAGVAPLGADHVRCHRPRVVDRHALAPEEDAADESRSEDVSLRRGVVM